MLHGSGIVIGGTAPSPGIGWPICRGGRRRRPRGPAGRVRELVGDEALTALGVRRVFACAEDDILADGERAGAQGAREGGLLGAAVHAHAGEIWPKRTPNAPRSGSARGSPRPRSAATRAPRSAPARARRIAWPGRRDDVTSGSSAGAGAGRGPPEASSVTVSRRIQAGPRLSLGGRMGRKGRAGRAGRGGAEHRRGGVVGLLLEAIVRGATTRRPARRPSPGDDASQPGHGFRWTGARVDGAARSRWRAWSCSRAPSAGRR